ncbi:hypothetical protein [Micromonospora sp. CA-244673]|uniref:hypothetical protein n=1 Tax=Micromonospora sp. CA-244673 TaxID=3239958 RepID=UPI003D943293
MVAVGAFPTDPIDPTDPRFVTTAGSIHAVAGILSFTCCRSPRPRWSGGWPPPPAPEHHAGWRPCHPSPTRCSG